MEKTILKKVGGETGFLWIHLSLGNKSMTTRKILSFHAENIRDTTIFVLRHKFC